MVAVPTLDEFQALDARVTLLEQAPPVDTGIPAGTMQSMIEHINAEANLVFCVDAGDSASYPSGQSWLDTSGNGHDFTVGETTGGEASDPGYNGTPGGLSSAEYFALDGADYFRHATVEPSIQAFHKDNATFTILIAFYVGDHSTTQYLVGSADNTNDIGFSISVNTSGNVNLLVTNGSGVVLLESLAGGSEPNTWQVVAFSVDEDAGAGGSIKYASNSGAIAFDGTYSAPSTSDTNETELVLGGRPTASYPLVAGSRLGVACAWDRALGQTEIEQLAQAVEYRYDQTPIVSNPKPKYFTAGNSSVENFTQLQGTTGGPYIYHNLIEVDIGPVNAGDLIDINAHAQISSQNPYNLMVASVVKLTSSDVSTATTLGAWVGEEITEAVGVNIDNNVHHLPIERNGRLVATGNYTNAKIVLIVYTASTAYQSNDVITVDQDYGRLDVMVYPVGSFIAP